MPIVVADPFNFEFNIKETALVVIDMQRDFLEPGGFGESLGNNVSLLNAIIEDTAKLIELCRSTGITVIHTKEAHRQDLSDCPPAKRLRGNPPLQIGDVGPMGRILIEGEPGNDIVPALQPIENELVIEKPGKGAFYNTTFRDELNAQGIEKLIVAGVTTEVCVQTTMREANDRGYDCLLIKDCTESYFPEFKMATLAMITAQGGIIGWTASLVALSQAFEGT